MSGISKPKKDGSRGEYVFTEQDHEDVSIMAAGGIPQGRIAKHLGISEKTLRKHFQDDLQATSDEKHKKVLSTAFQMATSGNHPAMTMFWLKCRLGWKEKQTIEHAAPSGSAEEVPKVMLYLPENGR